MIKLKQLKRHPLMQTSMYRISRIRALLNAIGDLLTANGPFALIKRIARILMQEGGPGISRRITFYLLNYGYNPAKGSGLYDRNDYHHWLQHYGHINNHQKTILRDRIKTFHQQPKISILMPVYNPSKDFFQEAVDSIRSQLYENWELCIADDASTDLSILDLMKKYQHSDARIKVVLRARNGHISIASNSALAIASGDFIALMDQDDVIPEEALYCIVEALNRHPQAKIIYSDEDRLSKDGIRVSPYHKTDWNRELFYSQNLISHLGVYAKDLLDKIGGFRAGFEGSQDYDLALRAIEQIADHEIIHIPRVLYHWREHDSSTSKGMDKKPYAAIAGEKALNEHFKRCGLKRTAEYRGYGYDNHFYYDNQHVSLSLMICVESNQVDLDLCWRSLQTHLDCVHLAQIHLIDLREASQQTPLTMATDKPVKHHQGQQKYALINTILQQDTADKFCLINAQTVLDTHNFLSQLLGASEQQNIGVVAPALVSENQHIFSAGVVLSPDLTQPFILLHQGLPRESPGHYGRNRLNSYYTTVSMSVCLMNRSVVDSIGYFDTSFVSSFLTEMDFCIRATSKGLRNMILPSVAAITKVPNKSSVHHFSDHPASAEEIARLYSRWQPQFERDAFYSPNLTPHYPDFSLAWPPTRVHLAGEIKEYELKVTNLAPLK